MTKRPTDKSQSSAHTHLDTTPWLQQELLPLPPFRPKVPASHTRAFEVLQRLLQGEHLTQVTYGLFHWRLAAYIKALRDMGWPVSARLVVHVGHRNGIAEYWFDAQTLKSLADARGGL